MPQSLKELQKQKDDPSLVLYIQYRILCMMFTCVVQCLPTKIMKTHIKHKYG